jgi:hypothetical protein
MTTLVPPPPPPVTTPTAPRAVPLGAQLSRFAWPAAFVTVAAMTFGYLHDVRPKPASEVTIEHATPTVLKDLRELSRLETLSLHVEKVIDVKDRQTRLYGLVDAEDSLLFVATGEVVLGVDLGKLADADARYDEATRTAYIHLPAPEVLSKRNEALESIARRDAAVAFEAAAKDPKNVDRAKAQAEKQLRGLGHAWGARDVVITWRTDAGSSMIPPTML